MSKRQRLVMVGIAVVIAAVAVVIAIGSGGGDDDDSDSTTAAQTETTTGLETTDENSGTRTVEPDEEEPAEEPEPAEPAVTVINVKGGEPVDGVAKIKVKKGDEIRITVVADQADHAHLHGYDIEKDVGPGQKARFREKADLEGVYELELHDSGAQLARITVEP